MKSATFSDLFDFAGSASLIAPLELQLTPDTGGQVGSVFTIDKIDFSKSFSIDFEAYMGADDGGADGIAIVFHDDPAGSSFEAHSFSYLMIINHKNAPSGRVRSSVSAHKFRVVDSAQ